MTIKEISMCLFLFFSIYQNGQTQTEYMPIGARYYGRTESPRGTFTTYSEKDTLCDGVPCRKIVQIERVISPLETKVRTFFSRQVGDSVFYFQSQKFEFAFRTNMSIGDSISYKYYRPFQRDTAKATLFVDSIMTVNSIRITSCRILCPNYSVSGQVKFGIYLTDRYGTGYIYQPPVLCDFGLYESPVYFINCYRDNQTFYTTSNFNGSNCELSTSTVESLKDAISVSPNPIQNYFDISCSENIYVRQSFLVDALGQIIQVKNFDNVKTVHCDLNNVPNGIYFMKIVTSSGHSIIKKVIINP